MINFVYSNTLGYMYADKGTVDRGRVLEENLRVKKKEKEKNISGTAEKG